MQCKIIIKQNDHDVCKTGLDKEHAGIDLFEQKVCHSLSVKSHNQNELIQGKFGNHFFAFVKKGKLMS